MLHPESTGRTALATLAAALLALAAPSARATEADYLQTGVRVRVTGVDATTATGARVLYQRLRVAAARACDDGRFVDADCARLALAGAVRTLDVPGVTALHERRARGAGSGA